MALSDIAVRLIGAFYVLGGAVLVRAILSARVLDQAIAAISGERAGSDPRAVWHLANAVLIFAGGVAAMMLSDLAVWLFATSLAGQAFYFMWLAPYLDRVDPPNEEGRRQSVNAFVIYAAATAFIAWAWSRGRLFPWQDEAWQTLAAAGCVVAVLAVYAVVAWRRPLPRPAPGPDTAPAEGPASGTAALADTAGLSRIKVAAEAGCHALWSLDPGNPGRIMPDLLPISAELVDDLETWAAEAPAFGDAGSAAGNSSMPDRERLHAQAGRRLAARLAAEMPDVEVFVSAHPTGDPEDLVRVTADGSGAA